jgi:hypothetical protein
LAVALALGGNSLAGQAPDDARLLASLDAAVGPGALPEFPRADDNVARQIQDGLEDLDRYLEAGDRRAIERALFRFNQASVRRPDWAWPEYAMARAFLLLDDLGAPVLQSDGARDGELHTEAMWRHLREALHRDPGFTRARRLLGDLAYAAGDRELAEDVLAALTVEVSRRDVIPDALIAWGRHKRSRGDHRLALAIFEQAGAHGADRSVLGLERARTLIALGRRDEARTAYWQGVDGLTDRGRHLYRQDLGWILEDDSLATLDAVPDSELSGWLRRFWGERDAAVVKDPGHREVEHLRRWVHAFSHFRVTEPWRRIPRTRVDFAFDDIRDHCVGSASSFYQQLPVVPPALPGDIRRTEALLDHRGIIYLRHGEPFARAVPPAVLQDGEDGAAAEAGIAAGQEGLRLAESLRGVEVWVYWVEGTWRVFQFRGSEALGHDAATTMSSYLPWQSVQAWQALARMLPAYRQAANWIANYRGIQRHTCLPEVRTAVGQQRHDAVVGISTDTERHPILEPWNSVNRFFALGPGAGRPARALITFAVPVADLTGEALADEVVALRLRFHMVAYRLDDGRRIDIDTTRTFLTPTMPTTGHLTGWFELPLEPGNWQVAVVVHQPADSTTGGYALRRGLRFGDTGGLALSDVVTGRAGQPAWPAPDGPFPVNALGTWPQGGTVDLWYEVRGVPGGEEYRTTVRVLPLEGRRGEGISVTATDRAPGGTITIRRTLGLANLDPGSYRLVVTVEHDGREAVREQEILVTDDG